MSYVLDALKKSDQERQRRTTPDIHSVHGTVEPRRKSRALWPYLLCLVLLLNAGLLLWWIKPWQPEKPAVTSQEESPGQDEQPALRVEQLGSDKPINPLHKAARRAGLAKVHPPKLEEAKNKLPVPEGSPSEEPATARTQVVSPSPGAQGPAVSHDMSSPRTDGQGVSQLGMNENKQNPEAKAQPSEVMKKNPAKPGRSDSALASAQKKSSVPLAADLLQERLQGVGAIPGSGSVEANRVKVKPEPIKSGVPEEGKDTASGDAKLSAPRSDSTAERSSVDESDSEAERSVPQFSQLPAQIRHQLPNLSFSMLVYSRNPAERIARINGQVVHEGDEVSAGLKLEHITPNGAIFTYRGYRFHKGVL
jgi:hypothetical protein